MLPILGISAAVSSLTRYQRPFMLVSILVNIFGIVMLLIILRSEIQKLQLVPSETK
jgi:hypothetical protein